MKERSGVDTNTSYDHEENMPSAMSRDKEQVIQLEQYVRSK